MQEFAAGFVECADLSRDIEAIGTLPIDYQNPDPGLPPRAP